MTALTDPTKGDLGMRTLVTGGSGFIGSAVVDRLVADGHQVTVVDDLSTGRRENLADALASGRVELPEVGRAGPGRAGVVAGARPEVVSHLAAQIDVRRSVSDPLHDARVNVLGTIALAKAALEAGCRRLVFASSGGPVYGEPDPSALPIDERYPPRVTNPYGVSKRSAEDYLASFAELHGLEPVSLRLGNVYGPRQDPHGEAGVVAIFCNRLRAEEPVTIFGDGRQTRDYVFVEDVVDAFVAGGEHPDAPGARVNIGTGVETSVLELYDALRGVAGFGAEPEFAPARPGELARIALDCGEAGRVLGWAPKADLADGLARTWAWAFQAVNAISTELAVALAEAVEPLATDPGVRAVVLTGAGERAFCVGADLKQRAGFDDHGWFVQREAFRRGFAAVRRCPLPTVAAVRGFALGGGTELALACDLVVAAEDATFGLPEVRLGLVPAGGGTQLLVRRVGRSV